MSTDPEFDVLIIGGGLAGLALSIQLNNSGYKVLVLEKDNYPHHKVCGEYVSMESKAFLERTGVPISLMNLPVINTLQISDTRGRVLNTTLPQGGFGISRYKLDATLAMVAQRKGVSLLTNTRAEDVQFAEDVFSVKTSNKTFTARMVCGCWGKRSRLDTKFQRDFIKSQKNALTNFVGVKYHIKYPWPEHLIALHNFRNGYCGISRVEDETCCLCYLTTAANLQESGNDIRQMERNILTQNPYLKEIFAHADFLFDQALTISQISFREKELVQDHVLMLGDAAGMISPLCGNGMSMAFHSSVMAFDVIDQFLQKRMSREQMEIAYAKRWNKQFAKRLDMGRFIQRYFGKERDTSLFLNAMKLLPFLQKPLIRATAGKAF